jgi:hypothetical protein
LAVLGDVLAGTGPHIMLLGNETRIMLHDPLVEAIHNNISRFVPFGVLNTLWIVNRPIHAF